MKAGTSLLTLQKLKKDDKGIWGTTVCLQMRELTSNKQTLRKMCAAKINSRRNWKSD